MPFGDGFNWGDWSTYTWREISVLSAAAFLIVLIFIIDPIAKAIRNKKVKEIVQESTVGSKKRIVFKDEDGDSIMIAGPNAWYIEANGKTELFKAVEGNNVAYFGKVIFGSKEVKRVQITQEGDNFVKHASVERHYITFDFISDVEVRLGTKVFLTDREISRRMIEKRKQEEIDAKKQEKAQMIERKNQAKEDKKNLKKEKKLAKKNKNVTEQKEV